MQLKNKLLTGTVLLSSMLTSCGFHKNYPQASWYTSPSSLPPESREYYAFGSVPAFSETIILLSTNEELYTYEVRSFCNDFNDKEVTFEYYRTKIFEKPPLVLVSPILGGEYIESRPVCELLAENGISAVLVHRPNDFSDTARYSSLEELLSSIVRERRQILEILVQSGGIDENRMGSYGLSMGAITNVPLVAVEPRLKYNIFGLVGGNVPAILLESSEGLVQNMLQKIIEKVGEEGLKKHLWDGYRSDPLDLAQYVDAHGVRMFLARFDTVVPYKYGMLLREKMGSPETDVLPTGHYTTILYYFWIKGLIIDFFQKKFEIDASVVERRKEELSGL